MCPLRSRRHLLAGLGVAFLASERAEARSRYAGIRFQRLANRVNGSSKRYLLIHGNESTARQVLTEHMKDEGRGVAYLVENTTRYVAFGGGRLDPNRMFSNEAIQAIKGQPFLANFF